MTAIAEPPEKARLGRGGPKKGSWVARELARLRAKFGDAEPAPAAPEERAPPDTRPARVRREPPAAWPPERDAELERLWAQRPQLSCSEIAQRLGVSKNAVAGRVHRLLLAPRRPEADGEAAPRTAIAWPAPGECLWPLGDPRHPDFGFCRDKRQGSGPYCAAHHARAHLGAGAGAGR